MAESAIDELFKIFVVGEFLSVGAELMDITDFSAILQESGQMFGHCGFATSEHHTKVPFLLKRLYMLFPGFQSDFFLSFRVGTEAALLIALTRDLHVSYISHFRSLFTFDYWLRLESESSQIVNVHSGTGIFYRATFAFHRKHIVMVFDKILSELLH